MRDWVDFYFQWPWALFLLFLIPFWLGFYLRYQRSQWQSAFRFSYVAVIEHLQKNPSPWKRLWVPMNIGVLMVLLILALSRPTAMVRVPTRSVHLMMVMDISLSMMADDIQPSRIIAAKEEGIHFIESLPHDVHVGLEFFAGNTYVISPPTRDHSKIIAFLKSLRSEDLQPRTEIGSALQAALKSLYSEGEIKNRDHSKPPQQVIVLLSDGDSREGYPWNQAALNAKNQNVKIYTVGIGSPGETTIVYQNQVLPVTFREETLRQISELAGGQYFRVFSQKDFKTVYQQVQDRSIDYEERPVDFSYMFAGLALGVLIFSSLGEMIWVKKIPI